MRIGRKRTGAVLAVVAVISTLPACLPDDDDHCVCSTEFRMIQMRVVDEDGSPQSAVEVVATLTRTGEVLVPGDRGLPEGTYTVITDAETQKIRPGLGDVLRVRGTKDTRSFETEYLITVDDCRCHVSKAAGPDQVVIR